MPHSYKIAYVVGLKHCGSTLFDLLLNAHSKAVSLGEVFELHDYANLLKAKTERTPNGSACTCGAESIWDCGFWQKVNDEVQQRAGLTLRELDLRSDDPSRFSDYNRLLFDSVAQVSGAKLIIDSSKIFSRLQGLLHNTDLPVVPIHLMRDPKGQIYSILSRGTGSILGSTAHYRRMTLRTLPLLHDRDHIKLRYEKLVTAPEATLREVMPHFGLDYEARQLDWAAAERHNLAGNRMRRTSSSDIKLRDEWREKLGLARRAAIDVLTLPATYATRRY